MASPYDGQDHEPKMAGNDSGSPSVAHRRRRLPTWSAAGNSISKVTKKNIGDTAMKSKHEIPSIQKSAEDDSLNNTFSSGVSESEVHRGLDASQGMGKSQNTVDIHENSKRYKRGGAVGTGRSKMDHSHDQNRGKEVERLDGEKSLADCKAISKTRSTDDKQGNLGHSEGIKRLSQEKRETTELKQAEQTSEKFSKLLNGVVFAISGMVNPERADLRDKASQMGGQYRPDWNSDCTILFCALANTPKFHQVKKENGTIVSKDWILECHKQRELAEIDPYLMHAGKPWRQVGRAVTDEFERESSATITLESDTTYQNVSGKECKGRKSVQTVASLSKVHEWANEDVNASIVWLQQQEIVPEAEELKTVAIQGILLCLDEAIACIQKNQSISSILETWAFVPRAVRELAAREDEMKGVKMLSNEDILHEAERLKWIYADVLNQLTNAEEVNLKFRQGKREHLKHDNEEEDDATEVMSEDREDLPLDWESDETEVLDEDIIRKAEQKIRKMIRGHQLSSQH